MQAAAPSPTLTGARVTPLVVAGVAALALAVAWYAEHRLDLVPCAFCLLERWPYRVAIGLGLLAFLLPPVPAKVMRALLILALLVGVGLGVTHVGVEQGWWPDPLPECRAPTFQGGSVAERLAAMPQRPAKPCDAPAYLIPGLPLDMAAMDALLALALAALVAISWPRALRR